MPWGRELISALLWFRVMSLAGHGGGGEFVSVTRRPHFTHQKDS
jgi:hypothetical protein